jgi:hypothetical protein
LYALLPKERNVNASNRLKYLRIALWVFGLIFIFGFWPLTQIWPSGWTWHMEGRSYYLEMIMGLYATLGVFLILAARDPLNNLSIIWFTVWSSVVHAGIMAVQSFDGMQNMGHLYGDVPALLAVAAILAFLTPRKATITAHNPA